MEPQGEEARAVCEMEEDLWLADKLHTAALRCAVQEPTLWVDREYRVHELSRIDTMRIKRTIQGIRNGKRYYGQRWKLPHLKAELQRRTKGGAGE